MKKSFKRGSINFLLFLTFVFSIYLVFQALRNNEWNTIASCLAVITAVLATYLSMRIVWKQEDDYEPDIIIFFDLESKTGVIQLVIKNIGGSNAYDLKLLWSKELYDGRGNLVDLPYVPVLSRNKSIRLFVDGSQMRFQKAKEENLDLIYQGELQFKTSKRNRKHIKKTIEISLSQFRQKAKAHTDEKEFFYKNKELNESIRHLNESIKSLIEKRNH